MGVKGFQKGHIVSDETRAKISKANIGQLNLGIKRVKTNGKTTNW